MNSGDSNLGSKKWLASLLITVYVVVVLLISGLSKSRVENELSAAGVFPKSTDKVGFRSHR